MLIIGLTGGIGSGKSTVTDRFIQLGIPVIDADLITRELVEPGLPAFNSIVKLFGTEVITTTGQLDRAKLRQRIFTNPLERKALEAILHPLTREKIRQRIAELNSPYCVLSIPLLLESGWQDDVDRILVVDATMEQQIERTCQRDKISRKSAQAIINNQIDRTSRLAAADDVIKNDGDLESLLARVDQLHAGYLALAKNQSAN